MLCPYSVSLLLQRWSQSRNPCAKFFYKRVIALSIRFLSVRAWANLESSKPSGSKESYRFVTARFCKVTFAYEYTIKKLQGSRQKLLYGRRSDVVRVKA